MKRSLLIAALSTVAAGSALAQSSVTVYGRLNETVERQKDAAGESTTVLANNASRLGFKGTEDLGGGLKANFLIEHRFNADNGAVTDGAANFWSGDSWVGLSSNLGDLRLGRMTSGAYFATADYVSYHNHDTGSSSDALYSLGYLGWRTNNKISYTTPSLGGATVELQYSLRESTTTGNNATDLAFNYGIGNLAVGAGFTKIADDKQFAVRGQYTFGDFTLGGYYQRTAFKETYVDGGKSNIVRLSAMYALGASEFHANVGLAGKIDGVADTDAKQFTLGYNYNLSKRTKAYTYYTKVDAKDATPYASDFSSVAVGIRHNF
jgi:predicted porin